MSAWDFKYTSNIVVEPSSTPNKILGSAISFLKNNKDVIKVLSFIFLIIRKY